MLLGKAKHLHCLQESHSEKPAMAFPGISSWFYLGKGDLLGVCEKKGSGKWLLELLGGEQEPLFLGLWKIGRALDWGHSCKCLNSGWKRRNGGKCWICGLLCTKCFETEKKVCWPDFPVGVEIATHFCGTSCLLCGVHHPWPWLRGCQRAAEFSLKSWPHCLLTEWLWLSHLTSVL